MSNLDWIRTLSAEELVEWINTGRVSIRRQYTDSDVGLIQWLNDTREEKNND